MKTLIFAVLLATFGQQAVVAVTHSLKYFYTASSGLKSFPEFVNLGLVDDQPVSYYDSVIKKKIPKQEWMAENEGPSYWEMGTQVSINAEQSFKANIDIAKQRFNQTGGVHILQIMYGCEWDDQTEEVTGYRQHGYDGEDWIIWDVKENRWITPKQQAEITTNRWNNDKGYLEVKKNYLTHICPEWLKKYVDYGRSSLMRTDLPSVSFLQKSSSSPVSCHATGFYPNRAEMFWRKDGEEIHDGVVKGEILPNNDGTFQMSADIDLSSVKPEDWNKYQCVFQLSGVREDIIHRLEKAGTRSNESNNNMWTIPVVAGVVVAVVALLVLIGVIGFILYKKKNGRKHPVYIQDLKTATPRSEDHQDSSSSLTSKGSDESQGSASASASSEKPLLQHNVTIN